VFEFQRLAVFSQISHIFFLKSVANKENVRTFASPKRTARVWYEGIVDVFPIDLESPIKKTQINACGIEKRDYLCDPVLGAEKQDATLPGGLPLAEVL
jgi:hypothetical protein